MTRLIRSIGLVLGILGTSPILGLIAGPAFAQQSKLQAREDRVMGCALTFTGPIETGDAALFAAAVAEQPIDSQLGGIGQFGTRICLDSPGGVLAEGVKIARIIHNRFGTAVPSGATYESACAVVFMAGSREPEGDPRGGVRDRVLHPLGKLGFHAPALDVADGQYKKTAVTFAFNAAVGAIGDLVSVARQMDFPETLLTRMLSTPSQEMYHITTVADAARWGIAVAPTVLPERIDPLAVFNACTNHYRHLSDFRGQAAFNENDAHTVPVFFAPEIGLRNDLVEATLEGFGQELASTCSVSEWRGEAPASPWDGSESGWRTAATPMRYMPFSSSAAQPGLSPLPRRMTAVPIPWPPT